MGPERLDRTRTVEPIAAVTAPGRPPWASAGSGRYPPRAVWSAAGGAMGLLGASADGHGGLIFPAVDSAGQSVGAGRRNRACVAGIGIAPARGHPAWTGLQRGLPCASCIESDPPGRGRHRSHYRETTTPWFPPPWPRSRICRFRPWIRARLRRCLRARAPSIRFTHDRRTCKRPETGPRSPQSLPSSNGSFDASRRGSESRSLALVPTARKAPISFSPWRARMCREHSELTGLCTI